MTEKRYIKIMDEVHRRLDILIKNEGVDFHCNSKFLYEMKLGLNGYQFSNKKYTKGFIKYITFNEFCSDAFEDIIDSTFEMITLYKKNINNELSRISDKV